ncbi:hypothetical protein [Mesorhizobium sp.]|uniref:hypothetical protein n=1 Tax=Mesorhizobium sp. TaxID=1871066 RepID=UPI000FE82100|nr:hypothetical protein [Mesorhizobium sp.]RWA85919.1 MAG: hypothetical protein EOQ30_03810 [Mesorhizobium sp.]
MNVVNFPKPPLEVVALQLLNDLHDHPERFRRLNERALAPEGNKTESIYRWLRVGKPKSVHLMAYSLQITYPAVRAIIDDLRVKGAKIVSVKKKGYERRYKMKGGPHTYAGLKGKCSRDSGQSLRL